MKIRISSTEHIKYAAQEFLNSIGNNKLIAFRGEMGAGKTTFIKALCAELGVSDVTSSPTFSIVNEYRDIKGNTIYHFDFYRIKSPAEALDMGCDEYFYSNHFCFIEWPEMIEQLLPSDCLQVKFWTEGEERILEF